MKKSFILNHKYFTNYLNFIRIFFYFLLMVSQIFNCKAQDCPTMHPDLSERLYKDYCGRLKDARAKNDFYQEGLALANLKQSPEQVFDLLYKGIKQHDTLCYKIHEFEDLSKNNGFKVIIVKIDSIRWNKLCIECEKIITFENYLIKKQKQELAYKKEKALLESKLDSNLLDKKLIAHLEVIIERDQRVLALKNPKEKEARNTERLYLDSLNLFDIDMIFKKEGGYPSLQKVGYDQIMTPWYVLQHQYSPIIRRKYMPYIEEAVQKKYLNPSLLDNYKGRTLNHEDAEQRKKQKATH